MTGDELSLLTFFVLGPAFRRPHEMAVLLKRLEFRRKNDPGTPVKMDTPVTPGPIV
jgi:hypothetical protein